MSDLNDAWERMTANVVAEREALESIQVQLMALIQRRSDLRIPGDELITAIRVIAGEIAVLKTKELEIKTVRNRPKPKYRSVHADDRPLYPGEFKPPPIDI